MSNLTDNLLYPSAERIWLCIRLNNAGKYCDTIFYYFGKKNHLFRWTSFWSRRACKQAKLSHLGHRKPARIHWKADAPKRVTVWCGIWSRGIILSFFFENEQGKTVTVNGDCYRAMLNEFLFTKTEEEDIGNIWFQQDGTTCQTAETTLDVLNIVFEDRISSRWADVVWPPSSCDLTPLNYYLWGTIKDKCYADKPDILLRTIFVKPSVKYSCTQSVMCLKIGPIM